MNRRDLLLIGASGLGSYLVRNSALAFGAPTLSQSGRLISNESATNNEDPHFFLKIYVYGGIDSLFLFDSRDRSMTAEKFMHSYIKEAPEVWQGRNGVSCLATAMAREMSPYKDHFSVVNGVMMSTGFDGHLQNVNFLFTGNPFGGESFVPHINDREAKNYKKSPLDVIQSGSFALDLSNGGNSVLISADSAFNLIEVLKKSNQLDLSHPVMSYLNSRYFDLGKGQGRFSLGSMAMGKSYQNSPDLSEKLKRLKLTPPAKAEMDLEARFIELATNCFREGITNSALYQIIPPVQNLDTHSASLAKQQDKIYEGVWTKLKRLFYLLVNTPYDQKRSLMDVTTIMFSSEFGRTLRQPGLPLDDTGTDHNSLNNSILIGGKGIKGGLVIGETDWKTPKEVLSGAHKSMDPASIKLMGKPFDFATGKSRTDLPTTFNAEDYLNFASVVNTIYSSFSVPKSKWRTVKRDGPKAPVISQLLSILFVFAAVQVFSSFVFSSYGFATEEYINANLEVENADFDQRDKIHRRIDSIINKMNIEEKILLLHGNPNAMETNSLPQHKIPAIKMADGPLGVRHEKATAFPAGILSAATFDPSLMLKMGEAMGLETRAQGRDMLLGPCVNLSRTPHGGRNFESFGEDPYLASLFAASWVKGVQSKGVIASTKHLAVNDQEYDRMNIDVRIDERTLHEIHLPAFAAALRAGTLSVMSAYNKINGHYASENRYLQDYLLKRYWKFPGFVVSDWEAVHSTVESANSGLDLEMPSGKFWGQGKLLAAVKDGQVSESIIDDKVRRIIWAMIKSGTFDRNPKDQPKKDVINQKSHQELARKIAEKGIVLLKNQENILPIKNNIRKIAVIGPNAAEARNNGGGSSRVLPFYDISPLQGLINQNRGKFQIEHAIGVRAYEKFRPLKTEEIEIDKDSGINGLKAEYFNNPDLKGQPVLTRVDKTIDFNWGALSPDPSVAEDNFSVRWTGYFTPNSSELFEVSLRSDDGARIFIDDEIAIDDWAIHSPNTRKVQKLFEKGKRYHLRVEFFEDVGAAEIQVGINPVVNNESAKLLDDAADLAQRSDLAIVFVGFSEWLEGEAWDRTFSLPTGHDQLIQRVTEANPNTIVVLNGGGSLAMPWLSKVKGVIYAWYPGQEGGNAIANLIYGHSNFSGKLPVTFYAKEEDSSAFGNYPGGKGFVHYNEGLFLGYRFIDKTGKTPLFPFGFGLSYSKFKISTTGRVLEKKSINIPYLDIDIKVKNLSDRDGEETIQVYIEPEAPLVTRPIRELKALRKVWLRKGETKGVRIRLDRSSFSYYDLKNHSWRIDPGGYKIMVGNSSKKLELAKPVRLTGKAILLEPIQWGENRIMEEK